MPKMPKSMTMRQFFHLYVEPPHCSASKSATRDGRKKSIPSGSSRLTCVQNGAGTYFCLGGCQKRIMKPRVMAPIGRLM